MAHVCPGCGQVCHRKGDIDDIVFGTRYDCYCCPEDSDDDDDHPLNPPLPNKTYGKEK